MLYNVTGMFVTDSIGAVARTVLESLRTLFVWLVRDIQAFLFSCTRHYRKSMMRGPSPALKLVQSWNAQQMAAIISCRLDLWDHTTL